MGGGTAHPEGGPDVGERLERLRAGFNDRVAALKRRQRALLERVIARLDREAAEKVKRSL